MNTDRILAQRKIIVASGSGGVGKTSISAALALRAARSGRRAVVVTIDPAKRLANALGLKSLGSAPCDLTDLARKSCSLAGAGECKGEFWALMPDTHHSLEELVDTLATSRTLALRVKDNPIFRLLSQEFSGANEYMAIQRLAALENDARFDCIILDTPPNRNVLAFLAAPRILSQFFDEKIVRFVLSPALGPANRLVTAGMKKVLGALEKLTGSGFMTQLFDFGAALLETRTGFTRKMDEMLELLASEKLGFLLVMTPQPEKVDELRFLVDHLRRNRFHFDGVVLNRTLGYLGEIRPSDSPGLEILRCEQEHEREVENQIHGIQRSLRDEEREALFAKLPELARDVHGMEDLWRLALALD